MIKAPAGKSYAATASSRVNYPKFKSRGAESPEKAVEKVEKEAGSRPARPGTYTKRQAGGPSRDDIVAIINNSQVFDDEDNRAEMVAVLRRFIAEKTGGAEE